MQLYRRHHCELLTPRLPVLSLLAAALASLLVFGPMTAEASPVGQILACYACQSTGNPAVDAALAANPAVANDGILFAFVNTSTSAITGAVFSEHGSPADSFTLPTIAAGATFILIPGITSDGGPHAPGGLFALGGAKDTSDGDGGLSDSTQFLFTGIDNGLTVTSITAGTSTGVPGTFTPGDPGLIKPFRDNPANGSTSFIGLGPSGDGGCSNCYYGLVATLNTPSVTAVPEPTSAALFLSGSSVTVLMLLRRRLLRKARI